MSLDTVRRFGDDEVRPVARELEHANTYPAALIGRMKEPGVCHAEPDASPSAARRSIGLPVLIGV